MVYIFRKVLLTLRCEILFDISHFFFTHNKKKKKGLKMEITITINGNSEYELYNEFMNKLLKIRNNNNKTAKNKRSLKELFKTIPPFCIKTAESVFPAKYKDITKDTKKLWTFVNNLKAAGVIKPCGYTKPKGSTRLYVSYCGVDYDPKSMTVKADSLLSVDTQRRSS